MLKEEAEVLVVVVVVEVFVGDYLVVREVLAVVVDGLVVVGFVVLGLPYMVHVQLTVMGKTKKMLVLTMQYCDEGKFTWAYKICENFVRTW